MYDDPDQARQARAREEIGALLANNDGEAAFAALRAYCGEAGVWEAAAIERLFPGHWCRGARSMLKQARRRAGWLGSVAPLCPGDVHEIMRRLVGRACNLTLITEARMHELVALAIRERADRKGYELDRAAARAALLEVLEAASSTCAVFVEDVRQMLERPELADAV